MAAAAAAVAAAVAASRTGPAIPLVQGTTVGAAVFPDGDTPQGGTGQPVDGVECGTTEQLAYHIHAHLTLVINGRQVAVPEGIGVTPPFRVQQGFVGGGGCFYWIHTHDATGIIHVESPVRKTFNLGNFFAIWGQALSPGELAGTRGTVTAYVNGAKWDGDPRAIPLRSHDQITLEVGDPVVPPPTYRFPTGL